MITRFLNHKSGILKLAIFATGLSGIVAEYILSTLATYFLGDSVFQWTMIVSVMMFSMGLGSRISKVYSENLLRKFLTVEFALSTVVAFSSVLVYSIAAYTIYVGFIIYFLSILVGVLIGMEIPMVIRINNDYESLRLNVSSIMEKDYYGSLAGGVFFGFIGLPILGLTYTPFLLGGVNFLVAVMVLILLWPYQQIRDKRMLSITVSAILGIILAGSLFAKPIILYGEQKKYADKVIFEKQSLYQKIVITEWKEHHWLFINGNQQLSSLDEVMYHEPLVHPAMKLAVHPQNILVLGGGDGCAVREILKYPEVKSIHLVDLDPEMTRLGQENPILLEMNKNSLNHPLVTITNADGYTFMEQDAAFYDVIIIDLPDPKTIELGRLYSYEFYKLCYRHLRPNGVMITQAGSPYYAGKAFSCIKKTIAEAGFAVLPMHNQVITLGEWGWVIGAKFIPQEKIKEIGRNLLFDEQNTSWLNNDAMYLMTSFGKEIFRNDNEEARVYKIHDPVLYKYYMKGNWDLY